VVNVRVMTALNGLAMVAVLLGGCAGNATRDQDPNGLAALPDLEQFPQITLSGAERAEVKALAMGAARSKGWSIGRSAADRMVAQRPLDAKVSATLGVKPAKIATGTVLEVTSYFVEEGNGVVVATQAEVVTPSPAPKKPAARTDYTEVLRDPLTESLAALREVWGEQQGRVARATPPVDGWKDAWSKDSVPIQTQTIRSPAPAPVKPAPPAQEPDPAADDAGDADDMTPVARPPLSAAVSPTPKVAAVVPAKPQPPVVKAPVAKPVVTAPKVVPPVVAKAAATKPVAAKAAPVTTGKPVAVTPPKTPVKTAPKAAPVVEVARSTPKPPAKPNNSMVELPKPRLPAPTVVKSSVSFAASAEKFARERGCKVSSKGTDLVESRKDGEIHKVPCVGADSVLVKCQKGSCKSLL